MFESSAWQATPAKRLAKLKVTDEAGNRIDFWQAVGRNLARYVSALSVIGYVMAAFTKRRQALHDKMAGTLVVKTR